MSGPFEAVKVADKVYWVGGIDWSVRDFHGYLTSRGTTYNAFLVLSDKPTLIDTVKEPLRDEMMSRIASVIDPAKIRYVVSNHAELDHSGCLPFVVHTLKPEKVFASALGAKALEDHFHWGGKAQAVKNGESLDLGGMRLSCVETRMVHWPDSMISYLDKAGVLFSQDAFGMHLASSERFADELPDHLLESEGAKYYANILLPYTRVIGKLLEKLPGLGFDIKVIAPDHGPMWREDLGRMPGLYSRWGEQKPSMKAVVVYDTMWQSTEKMAHALEDGLAAGGASVKLMPLKSSHRSDVASEVLDAGALIVGSPTINNNLFPTVADCMSYLKGLRPKNLVGASFGSHGWSGEAPDQIKEILAGMGVDLVDTLKVKYVPGDDDLARCRELGKAVAARMKEKSGC
ncbi:FprA family A-type flavoprotein [Elusimicrobiota bacterium]